MKDRARKIGQTSGFNLLNRLQQVTDNNVRFHLMGHSFGCIFVSATVAGTQNNKLIRPVNSLVLIQGALSLWSFCSNVPHRNNIPGYFRSIITEGKVAGTIVTTQSKHDKAVKNAYPMAGTLGIFGGQDIDFDVNSETFPNVGGIGCDAVFRKHQSRTTTMQKGKIIGDCDKLVTWYKPKSCPKGLSKDEFDALPPSITVREIYYYIVIPGFRTQQVSLITTLLDKATYSPLEIVGLYGKRCDVLATVPEAIGLPTLDELCTQLSDRNKQYTLLHFVSHGRVLDNGETVLYWSKADNTVEAIAATHLLDRLRPLCGAKGLPHFTFLCTCESASPDAEGSLGGLAQRLVRDLGMPAVVAMTDKVTIKTAQTLGEKFYKQLRASGEVDSALHEATAALAERGDVTVPALLLCHPQNKTKLRISSSA
ncbi:CHAT domain-containing protein [Nostoc sp. NMS2]|nr:CHAT domain-containing protein [Nostoc sp. NMS2]